MCKNIILYIGGFELPDKNAAAQRCVSNAKLFRDIGYRVILLGVNRQDNSSLSKSEYFGFTCWSIPYPDSNSAWLKRIVSLNYVDYLLEHEYKNHVFAVICYNYPAISQYRIMNLAKKYGIFTIADVTEWYALSGEGFIHKSIKWLDTLLRMRIVNLFMDGLITTSNYLTFFYNNKGKILLELPTLYDKCQLVYETHPKNDYKGSGYRLMYAGSPFDVSHASKDRKCVKERLDIIIHTMSELISDGISFELNIYGLTETDYLKVYPEDFQKIQLLNDRLSFKGRCSQKVVVENIINSDFTIFMRDLNRMTQAGFPTKFAESITYGTPVITNLLSNIEPYVIEGKNCFIIDIGNDKKRYEALKSILLQSRDNVKATKSACLESVSFDYRTFKKEAESFLEKVRLKG